ncbi:MAG: D-alanine--D-alanine ligase [Bacteroidales bacterium]|nr:D-alanine--D-alanine ligase [Bacteroidales bacterium]
MKTIAIVTGGNSSEFEISVKSARAVERALGKRYNTFLIMIRGSEWYWEDPSGQAHKVDKNHFTIQLHDSIIRFDAVFIAIHGTPGEDGLMQGYFEMTGIPYTGCTSYTSALTFNKNACKAFLKSFNVRMAHSIMFDRNSIPDPGFLAGELGLPMFIKPNESGSSFGVSKVNTGEEIMPAIEKAFTEGDQVLAEEFMDGTEVACGVIITGEKTIVLPLTEIVSKNAFFDYEAKYDPSKADEITPGRFPAHVSQAIQKTSSRIAEWLDCRGLVRVDFIVVNEEAVFIEVNTIPGITEESIVPKQMKEYGIEPGELYSMLIEDAITRKKS